MPFEVNGLFRKRTEASNIDMWSFLDATLQRHRHEVDLVIAGGDQAYSDGVDTLNIWKYLNATMQKDGDRLLPDSETMVSWYRDIYRGYWGFESLQRVFEQFPTYMVWDDHEIADGWGSHYFIPGHRQDGLAQMLPDFEDRGLTYDEGMELVQRMIAAAKQVYFEYQHSHNPPTAEGTFDYAFERGGCAFYVLDGRGQRDVSRDSYRILGREQFDRFAGWVAALKPQETPFLFVVSAVPVLHTRAVVVNSDEFVGGLGDDLRDSGSTSCTTSSAGRCSTRSSRRPTGGSTSPSSAAMSTSPRCSPSTTTGATGSTSSPRARSPTTCRGSSHGC